MNKKTVWIDAAVGVAIVAVAAGWWFLGQPLMKVATSGNQPVAPVQTSTDSSTPANQNTTSTTASGTQTYTDTTNGFSVEYLADMTLNTQATPYVSPDTGKTMGTQVLRVVSPAEDGNVRTDNATVEVSTDSGEVANCMNSSPTSKIVSINGTTFLHTTTQDAGLGMIRNTEIYKTLHNGTCFTLIGDIGGYSPTHYTGDEAIKVDADNKARAAKVNSVVQSFHFITPTPSATSVISVKYGPGVLEAQFAVGYMGLGHFWIDFGDGQKTDIVCKAYKPDTDACTAYTDIIPHTYVKAGTYTATYMEESNIPPSGSEIGRVTVIVK